MTPRDRIAIVIVLLLFAFATATSAVLGSKLNSSSVTVKNYKKDFFKANQLKYGLLNGQKWSAKVENIIAHKIDSFSLSSENKAVLDEQIRRIMHRLVDQVEVLLNERQDKLGQRIKMKTIKMFVDLEKVRAEIPRFSAVVVHEVEKSGNKDKVRGLVKEKIHDLLMRPRFITTGQEEILKKYKVDRLRELNELIKGRTDHIEAKQRTWGYALISIMGLLLVVWFVIIRMKLQKVYALAFMLSVLISFVNLYTGINLPMLEIDARIGVIDLEILNAHVTFYNQVLFYQSKSIIEVATILMTKGKFASVCIGVFILLFSVLFPVMKLICASIYLFSKKKKNAFIKTMAFKSGKWSMTDVLVVAIFIAYIGFQSIINEQLDHIATRANSAEQVNLLTTNQSNLQVGFIIFLAFVLFNLMLAVVLKRITQVQETRFRFTQWWEENRNILKKMRGSENEDQ